MNCSAPPFGVAVAGTADGLAYVAMLFLLVLLTTMGLAFVLRVGTEAAATLPRSEHLQAHYLAEAAANHALWRILNEPGFPGAENVYYVHSLAGNAYGYKVRKPTATTFASVATMGAVGNVAVKQSYVPYVLSRTMTAYDTDGDPIPKHRRLAGATWDAAGDTVNVQENKVRWMILEGCPIRNEIIMGALDDSHDINLAVWNGISWGNQVEFSTDAKKEFQGFDIAYESLSGDALVIGRRDSSSTARYKVWNGSNWASSQSGPDSDSAWILGHWWWQGHGASINYVVMESNPASNEILVAILDDASDITLWRWDGSEFSYFKYQIETNVKEKTLRAVDIAYEQQSNDAIIVWGRKDSSSCKYRVWDGSTLSAGGSLPSFGRNALIVRAVADPTSDHVFVAALDEDNDLNVAVWDGGSWTDSRELETEMIQRDRQCFDAAWEPSGEEVLVAWGTTSSPNSKIRYFRWAKGSSLADASVAAGPNFTKAPLLVGLFPVSESDNIALLAVDSDKDLRYSLWDGNRFAADPAILINDAIPYDKEISFDMTRAGG